MISMLFLYEQLFFCYILWLKDFVFTDVFRCCFCMGSLLNFAIYLDQKNLYLTIYFDAVSIYEQLAFAINFDQKILYFMICFDAVSVWAACFCYILRPRNFVYLPMISMLFLHGQLALVIYLDQKNFVFNDIFWCCFYMSSFLLLYTLTKRFCI